MKVTEKIIFWLPRVFSILYIAFISIFALDVFSEYTGFDIILPLFIHLIPSFVLLVITVVAWNYELVGAYVFLGFATFYVWDVGFSRPLSWYFAIALPASIVGVLYLICWMQKRRRHEYEN